MSKQTLTQAEQAVVDRELGSWVKSYEVIRTAPGRKLLQVVTPGGEEQYYTLAGKPEEPHLIFEEPVRFTVTVHAAKGECRAGHEPGDSWKFDWRTPGGMCGSAYHTMYPLLHGLLLTGGRYEGPAAEGTLVSCPDDGWITFRIERRRWTPAMWIESDN